MSYQNFFLRAVNILVVRINSTRQNEALFIASTLKALGFLVSIKHWTWVSPSVKFVPDIVEG